MNLFSDLMVSLGLVERQNSASTAKDRLKVVVSHSSSRRRSPDYLPMLERDILAVIAKYVEVDEDKVKIRFERRDSQSTLEVNVDLPTEPGAGSTTTRGRGSRAAAVSASGGAGASSASREDRFSASSTSQPFGDTRSGMRMRDTHFAE